MALSLLLAVLFWPADPAAAGSLELIDGSMLRGRVLGADAATVRVLAGDAIYAIPRSILCGPLPEAGPPAPFPAPPPPDRAVLADGGLVLGLVVEETPGTVTLLRGVARRTIRRERIAVLERGSIPSATPEMERFAREALARLAAPDPAVRDSALCALAALGPAIRSLLRAEAARPDLPAPARESLAGLLGEPEIPLLPPGAARLLRDPASGEAFLADRLGLSADQRNRTREALAVAGRAVAAALATFSSGARTEAAEALRTAVTDFERTMSGVLTDVQLRILRRELAGAR